MEPEEPTKPDRPNQNIVLFLLGLVIFIIAMAVITWRIFHKTTKPVGVGIDTSQQVQGL